ncbi:MAG: diacylglycerol kinase family lipid kinase [Bacteroidales bacterium]|nr:diacylglycerol kinase family lipid kinase [Bacteroidales bacterium]
MQNKKSQKWIFIVNPIAGNGDGERMIPELKSKIEAFKIPGEIVVTERPGHASDLTSKYADEGFSHIIAVGGDGTMNEIGKMLLDKEDIITGIVPAGTGNDFVQILGFPDRFEDHHWEIFFRQSIINMDYGTCNGIPFLNGMGLGFDAVVAAKNYVAPGETKMGGKGKYLKAILGTLFFFKEYRVKIHKDGKVKETDCFINTISNGRRYAGGFYLTPHAIANDGLLDICMIKKLGLFKRLDILLKVSKGAHTTDKKVNYYTTDRFEVDFGKEVPFHVDGEVLFASKFDVRIFPSKIPIIFNPEGNHYFHIDK